MRLIAEIESIGTMPPAVRKGKRANRDGQGFERGRRAVACGLAGQHAGDVGLERDGGDSVAATGPRDTDAKLRPRNVALKRLGEYRCSRSAGL